MVSEARGRLSHKVTNRMVTLMAVDAYRLRLKGRTAYVTKG